MIMGRVATVTQTVLAVNNLKVTFHTYGAT